MGRKRKVPIVDEEKENEDASVSRSQMQITHNCSTASANSTVHHGPMYTIMSNVQLNETFHKKYIKEMQQLYAKMDHDAFIFTFIKMIKSAMEADEGNDYANTTLIFCAKFVSSYDGEDTHPILVDICKWLLTTISNNPHIRFRLCQFVNMILTALGAEAALDDVICDNIMEYMLARLRDVSPSVRVQAILALQRLQVPDNPDDPVLRSYQFHLCSDPSPRVRQAVITSMGRNYNTIPYILDRLWDIDEKVRRHTYLHMSSYPVKSYKVSQRLTLMEQGLNDRSEMVRKVVITIMLQQWIESYQKNLILLVSGLKLDSNEGEIDRFRKVTKLTLKEIFKRQSKEDLIDCIPLEEDGEFHKCVPHEKLTIEISLYWQCLAEYLQLEMADELDMILPELSTFCAYVERFCESQKTELDKFEQMEFQYILLSLMEILYTYDLGDEIGRENLKKLITIILKNCNLYENIIDVIIKCAENLITDHNTRLQYFVEIIQEICGLNTKHNDLIHDRNLINELMEKSSDAALNLKLSSLKFKILELEEQEMNFVEKKDYVNAHKITEEKNAYSDEYSNLLKPLLEQHSSDSNPGSLPLQQTKKVTNESILKSLQIAFYMVVSKNVQSLTPNVCKLYNDFICRHIASNQIAIRDWALKCGTAYSMLYEALSKDVFEELYSQFFKNHNIRIWKTAITCIFELLDRYGMTSLVAQEQPNKSKKTGRLLYNTLEILDTEDEVGTAAVNQGVDVIFMMSHFLDTCDEICIMKAIINGFCRLVLRGHINNSDIMEKLLLRYFNPATDPEINQILGVFLENLIQRKKQELLYPCLLPTVSTVISAAYDSPLKEIKPETITRFVIDATRQEFCSSDSKIHNKLAEMFLQEMQNNSDSKDLCKLLAKELITLELNVADSLSLKQELKSSADKLLKIEFDPKTIKNIIDFKDLIDGVFNPPAKTVNENGSDDEDKSDDETVANSEKEIPRRSTEKTPDNLDNSKKIAEEVTSTDEQGKQSGDETPSTVANKAVSPSAAIPTTYGRENTVGIPYLRKSLNISRNNSISEGGDGPSRPPKIRIEARIDSDKKAQSKDQKQKLGLKNSRVRRNLRRHADEETASQNEDQTNDIEMLAERLSDDASSQVSSDAGDKPKTPPRGKSSKQKSPDKRKEKNSPKVQEGNKQRTRVTRRGAAAVVEENKERTRSNNKKPTAEDRVAAVSEELHDPDVIPPSPTAQDMNQTSIHTRKRAVLGRSITLRSTRSNTSLVPTTPKTSTDTIDNGAGGGGGSSKSTPLRNGRKRVLHPSPKSTFSSESTFSPLRKQSKIDKSPSKVVEKASTPDQGGSKSNRRASKRVDPPVSDGSPSSTKENEVNNQPSSPSVAAPNIPSIADDEEAFSSQSDVATNSTPKSKQVQSRQPTSSQVKRIRTRPGFVMLDRIGSSGISTRNAARKEHQSKTIMTRKRLSMENQPTSSASSVKSLSPARVAPVKKRLPSRIPVRKEASSSSTASENASSSSGADDTSSTKSSGSRRALTTKMTKINLTASKSGPVPMRLARPTRAKSPPPDGPTGSRYSRRRHI